MNNTTNIINSGNTYDIIIENVRRNLSMSQETPKYSKSEINQAGKIITKQNSTPEETDHALEILNNWRASHAYPLQVITSNLRRNVPDSIVVQRLKRLESITGKIHRYPTMKLSKMQDLGGCRVIVNSIDEVYAALNRYKNSSIRHILKKENDYIQNPKKSGYRSYHAIYQFQSDKNDIYNDMCIEIQLRTKLQHMWGTAIETMGVYTNTDLKSGQGEAYMLRFFTLASSLFAIAEGTPICPDTPTDTEGLIAEIIEINKQHNIISKLMTTNTLIDIDDDETNKHNSKNAYYLLISDHKVHFTNIRSFKKSELKIATESYAEMEKIYGTTKDIVLVSADSISSLKAAYPNYLSDVKGFVAKLKEIIGQETWNEEFC